VTIVAEAPGGVQTAISDEFGSFFVDVPPTTTKLTYYYMDTPSSRRSR